MRVAFRRGRNNSCPNLGNSLVRGHWVLHFVRWRRGQFTRRSTHSRGVPGHEVGGHVLFLVAMLLVDMRVLQNSDRGDGEDSRSQRSPPEDGPAEAASVKPAPYEPANVERTGGSGYSDDFRRG